MNKLLKMLSSVGGGTKAVPAVPKLNLAAFGKHPGWDDHIPGIGLETETLAQLKQTFYVGGIGSQIDSGAWEKLEPGKRVEGFAHTFLWRRQGHLILGRLWSSTDRKGRAKYPMILGTDSTGVSLGFLLANAWRELEQLQNTCRSLATAEQVATACQTAQARLRTLLEATPQAGVASPIPIEARRRFLASPQFGEQQTGLLRILHELSGLQSNLAPGRSLPAGSQTGARSGHLRVPVVGQSPAEIYQFWLDFFRCAFPPEVPLLLILRDGVEWLDVIVGETSGDEFFCLQATPLAAPLATQIPYELKPELGARLQQMTAILLGSPAAASAEPQRTPPPASPEAGSGASEAHAPARRSKLPLILTVLAVILLVGGGWFLFVPNKPSPALSATLPTVTATAPPTAKPAMPPTAPPVAKPAPLASAPLPTKAGTESQAKYDEAMKQAQAALQQQQFETAASLATAALAVKSNDPAALALREQASTRLAAVAAGQKLAAEFRAMLTAGRLALEEKHYDAAITQAQAALRLQTNDPEAVDLLAQANRGKKLEQDNLEYTRALQAAQSAFQQKQYQPTIEKAAAVLAIKPNDPTALDLQRQAKSRLADLQAAAQQQEQFAVLLQAGQTAFEGKNYAAAASNADAALVLSPEDPAARALRASARTRADYGAALSAGQAALARTNYAVALQQAESALALNPTGQEALKLKADAFAGTELQRARVLLGQTNYAAALALCDQHSNETAFTVLTAEIHQAELQELQQLDEQLEIWQVWFGILRQKDAKSAKARMPEQKKMAQEIEGGTLTEDGITLYNSLVAKLESRLKALHQLDAHRLEIITNIKKKIIEHS
jgi:hypothetical protein